ncbi:MAG: sensor histidine kinase [Thermoanaerobaculia bacterium]
MQIAPRVVQSKTSPRCVAGRAARYAAAAALALLLASDGAALPADRTIPQYVRRSWTVRDGLPHGTVRGFAQTSDGYIWLATYEGIVRFNGEQFLVFDKSSAAALDNSSVLTLCRTRDDSLWLGTAAGVVVLRNGEFEKLAQPGVGDELVNAIEEAADGTLWIGSWGGLSRVVNGKAERLSLPLPNELVNALALSDDGSVWIGSAKGGLARYRDGKIDAVTTANGLASDTIVTLLTDGRDAVLAGTTDGLDRIDGSGRVTHVAGIPEDQITALRRDRDGNLWVGTYSSGLFRIHDGEVSSYGIADGLLNPTVRAIFEDDEGSIWVGSNRGLEQLRAGAFVTWTVREGLANDFTRAIYEDRDGVLWVGTASGLSRWNGRAWEPAADPRLAKEYVLAIEQGADGTHWFGTSRGLYRVAGGRTTLLTTADGLSSNGIRAIHADRRGNVWVATDLGASRVGVDGRIESYAGRGGLGTDYTIAISETADGRVWIAGGGGLTEFDGTAFRVHSAPAALPSNRLFALHAEADGTLWIGTDGDGLLRFRDGVAARITTREGLPYDKIQSLTGDGKGSIWLGTARGAFKVSRDQLDAVADGKLPRLEAIPFDESDGLGSRQCNGSGDPTAFRSRDGRIWFVTADGVSALSGSEAPPAPTRKPVIESVVIDSTPVDTTALGAIPPGAERVEFAFTGLVFSSQDRLRFRYRLDGYDRQWTDAGASRTVAYTNLPAGAYVFMLEASRDGKSWQRATLPLALEPHYYEAPWFIALCVALVLGVLLALHLLRLQLTRRHATLLEKLVEDRTREITEEKARTELALRAAEEARREAERHEQITERALMQAEDANRAKSTFLATTSHELRTPLNAIIGFSDIVISHGADKLEPRYVRFLNNIHSSGEYLLGIINNILDLSKIEAGKMELIAEPIFVRETIHGICMVMRGVTTLQKINIELEIPDDVPRIEADPAIFKQIVYNLISNAVKFSPPHSTVRITARLLRPDASPTGEEVVELRVIDEGVGIDPRDHRVIFQEFRQVHGTRQRPQGTGLGLALVKRFVEMHRGTIRVESEPDKGSTFIVVLPCAYEPALADAASPAQP